MRILSKEAVAFPAIPQILPVISLTNEQEMQTFLSAIVKAEIRCIEITLRHPFAPKAIAYIKAHHPEILVGAGTVVTPALLRTAIRSGADFFVSPGFDEKIIRIAKRKHLVFLPGCATPSEILKAKAFGFTTVKFFPTACMGGPNALKLYQGAFADITFIPTGGITKENLLDYLRCGNVMACGGSFMIAKEKLKSGDADGICSDIMNCLGMIKEGLE